MLPLCDVVAEALTELVSQRLRVTDKVALRLKVPLLVAHTVFVGLRLRDSVIVAQLV